jgi:hypothetical protein
MIHAGRLAATLLVVLAATPVLADNLPAAAIELGPIRRNEQGRIEVVRTPADGPAVGRDGSQSQVLDKKVPSATANGRTIVVGPQEEVRSITEAARMARDGDTIEILPGEYRQQAVVWTQGRLTIRGVGKRPLLLADGASAEGKALWVVRNAEMLIENIEFRGARVANGNGAGIRFERGHLKVLRCAFFDNEMGILTGNFADTVLEVEDSEFGEAPQHASGALHHLLYAGGRLAA